MFQQISIKNTQNFICTNKSKATWSHRIKTFVSTDFLNMVSRSASTICKVLSPIHKLYGHCLSGRLYITTRPTMSQPKKIIPNDQYKRSKVVIEGIMNKPTFQDVQYYPLEIFFIKSHSTHMPDQIPSMTHHYRYTANFLPTKTLPTISKQEE